MNGALPRWAQRPFSGWIAFWKINLVYYGMETTCSKEILQSFILCSSLPSAVVKDERVSLGGI